MKIIPVSLATFAGGGAIEAVDEALATVWEDLADPNKDPEQARSVTLTLTVKTVKGQRMRPIMDARVKTSLAGYNPFGAQVYLEQGPDGLSATEIDPEQMQLPDMTGSDQEGAGDGVIPMRKGG